jgi:hypothetical protein
MSALEQAARTDASTTSSLTGDNSKHPVAVKPKKGKDPFSPPQLLLGLLFGVAFGFLLQKGGVAKYHVLMGVLLLEDMTVIKVMLSAIVVGMAGVFGLHALGKVKLHVKPTRYAANITGGLIFGVSFGLLGYCPGTGSAALGQGNFDALAGIGGLMAGSYVYAELSGVLEKKLVTWGDRGRMTFPELTGIPPKLLVPIVCGLLAIGLVLLNALPVVR